MPESITPRRRILLGATCWILLVEYYIAQLVAQSAWPGYRMTQYDVSALGATHCGPFKDPVSHEIVHICSPLHSIMNTGFVLAGVLMILGSFLVRRAWPQCRLSKATLLCIMASGVGEIVSGLAPGNVSIAIHATGAMLHWVFGTAAIVCFGLAIRRNRPGLAFFSGLCVLMVVTSFLLYGNRVYLHLGRGTMQRLMSYPLSIWLITLGVFVFRRARPGSDSAEKAEFLAI